MRGERPLLHDQGHVGVLVVEEEGADVLREEVDVLNLEKKM